MIDSRAGSIKRNRLSVGKAETTIMAQLFGHEKVKVYQKGMEFAASRSELPHATVLIAEQRAFSSTLLTLVVRGLRRNGSSTWDTPISGTDQAKFLGIAYKATVQSASLVDLATANSSGEPSQVEDGREMLRCIAAMLTSLSKVASHDT